jgi:hypothetical protein
MNERIIFKKPEAQLSLLMFSFLLYLSLPAFYWRWLKHQLGGDILEGNEYSTEGLWLIWFAGLVFIPLGLYLLVRTWQIARGEITSGR